MIKDSMLDNEFVFVGSESALRQLGFEKYRYSTSENYVLPIKSNVLSDSFGINKLTLGELEVDLDTKNMFVYDFSLKATSEEFKKLAIKVLNYMIEKNLLLMIEVDKNGATNNK